MIHVLNFINFQALYHEVILFFHLDGCIPIANLLTSHSAKLESETSLDLDARREPGRNGGGLEEVPWRKLYG